MKKYLLILLSSFLFLYCDKNEDSIPDDNNSNNEENMQVVTKFESYESFKDTLNAYTGIEDSNLRDSVLSTFMDSVNVPFCYDDKVAFIYYSPSAEKVSWAGDFNFWNASSDDWQGSMLNESGLWICEKTFPVDARLDYKIVVDDNWKLDPNNPHVQYSGFGPNSELRMPDWQYPQETILNEGISRGELSDNIIISSSNLGYDIQYKVYTPYNYASSDNLPVVYVTDGHEYADDKLGAMLIVTDNLIYAGDIEPIIIVFIDPREPNNLGNNRRAEQFRGNPDFLAFVTDELIPQIDTDYKTQASAEKRAIMGTSYGGWNAGYFGVSASDVFNLVCMHSPAFDLSIPQAFSEAETLPLKIYMSTGVINDTQANALSLKVVLDDKNYTYQYKEVNEGHSWGNWRALIDEPLLYFFGTDK